MTAEEYIAWMYNPANIRQCVDCPENRGESWNCLPCGQQNCWVTCHCYPERFQQW